MRTAKAIAAVILVFLLGAATGGLIAHLIYQCRMEGVAKGEPRATSDMILNRLDRELKLDADQRDAIRQIVQEAHGEIRQVRQQFRPQIRQIMKHSEEKIMALLRPDQQDAFKRLIEKRRRQWDKNGGGPPLEGPPLAPPPPPPPKP